MNKSIDIDKEVIQKMNDWLFDQIRKYEKEEGPFNEGQDLAFSKALFQLTEFKKNKRYYKEGE